jgi:single-strand DNA-binding protein
MARSPIEPPESSFHTLILVGRLGQDPQLTYTPSGQFVTHFTIATHSPGVDETGAPTPETTWFHVTTRGRMAEICQLYLHKGHRVLVEGRLIADPQTGSPRPYMRKSGEVGCAFEVNAATVRFLNVPGVAPHLGSMDEPTDEAERPRTRQKKGKVI